MLMGFDYEVKYRLHLFPPPPPLGVASCSLLALACWEDGYWISCNDASFTFEINQLTQRNYNQLNV